MAEQGMAKLLVEVMANMVFLIVADTMVQVVAKLVVYVVANLVVQMLVLPDSPALRVRRAPRRRKLR
jgi:hypothetical protein